MDGLAKWGLRWARDQLCDADLDAGGFMWDFHRSLKIDELPEGDTVFCVILDQKKWWLVVKNKTVDLCNDDPGYDVDLYITGDLTLMASLWMGDSSISNAVNDRQLLLSGSSHLTKTISRWFPKSSYVDVRPERFL